MKALIASANSSETTDSIFHHTLQTPESFASSSNTSLNTMPSHFSTNTIFKSREQQWDAAWLPHTPTYFFSILTASYQAFLTSASSNASSMTSFSSSLGPNLPSASLKISSIAFTRPSNLHSNTLAPMLNILIS